MNINSRASILPVKAPAGMAELEVGYKSTLSDWTPGVLNDPDFYGEVNFLRGCRASMRGEVSDRTSLQYLQHPDSLEDPNFGALFLARLEYLERVNEALRRPISPLSDEVKAMFRRRVGGWDDAKLENARRRVREGMDYNNPDNVAEVRKFMVSDLGLFMGSRLLGAWVDRILQPQYADVEEEGEETAENLTQFYDAIVSEIWQGIVSSQPLPVINAK